LDLNNGYDKPGPMHKDIDPGKVKQVNRPFAIWHGIKLPQLLRDSTFSELGSR
jgi:hypothetical protein